MGNYLYIIMDYTPGGDLGSLISQNGRLKEFDVKAMAGQLLSALKYLYNKGIIHRNIKPDNILIQKLYPLQVKLTGFGLSITDSGNKYEFCGTLLYCAPEVYLEYQQYNISAQRNVSDVKLPLQRYGHAVDIWSLAGTIFCALCGSPPYPASGGTSYQDLLRKTMTQALDIRPLQLVNVSTSGIRNLKNMLNIDPDKRATIEELECSSWLVGESLEASMEEVEVDMI